VVAAEKEGVDRKHEDPWNPKPKQQLALPRVVNPVPAVPTVAATVQAQARVQVQARRGLRYVENRTSGEAEKKMEEIVSDLFPYKEE
jgi:translation initiation factor IF-2